MRQHLPQQSTLITWNMFNSKAPIALFSYLLSTIQLIPIASTILSNSTSRHSFINNIRRLPCGTLALLPSHSPQKSWPHRLSGSNYKASKIFKIASADSKKTTSRCTGNESYGVDIQKKSSKRSLAE